MNALFLPGIVLMWSLLPPCSSKQVLKVGGEIGWTQFNIFSGQTPDYAAWASKTTLVPGDDIDLAVFLFFPQLHNIHMFRNHSEYVNCNFTESTLLDEGLSGVYTWTAPAPGTYYFGCSKDYYSHCQLGQKFAITVVEQSSLIHLPPAGSPAAAAASPSDDSSPADNGCATASSDDDDDDTSHDSDSSCSPWVDSPPDDTPVLSPVSARHHPDASVNPRRVPDFGTNTKRRPPPRSSSAREFHARAYAIRGLIVFVLNLVL
ncbi:hypothetical protein SELMODRAFT_409386 [Selaginella moellendorffii]|uniref:Phytocyanin domain-containing protein n=1 Tax=Selaginella moellendorffii TaxID=88036 RepID=D8RBA5_SELML|nr:hypothetical protein SELMODRAFT_409386 [Selaginella moellendorffii]